MSNRRTSTEELAAAVGAISLISDKPLTHKSAKLGSVEPGSVDAFYMVAAFCFDLERKMEYIFKAARGFALHAHPPLAREVLEDNETLNAPGLTWKERAERGERIMRRLYEEIYEEHDRLLREVASRKAKPPRRAKRPARRPRARR